MDLNKLFGEDNPNEKKEWKEWKPRPKLVPILEAEIVKYNEARKQSSPTLFRASEIGGCDKKFLYKFNGLTEEIDAKGYLTMNVGTAWHELLQTYLAEHFVSLEERLYFNDKAGDSSVCADLSGSYDGELTGKIVGQEKNILLEIKTTGVSNFQRLITGKGQLSNKYKFQNTVYLHAKGLDMTIFLMVNRNIALTDEFMELNPDLDVNPTFHEIIYRKDDAMVEKLRQKITDRKLHMKLGTSPKREKVTECSYCSFEAQCKAEHEQNKILAREAKKSETENKKEQEKLAKAEAKKNKNK